MHRKTVLFGLAAMFALAFVFFTAPNKAEAAFSACQCSCTSSDTTQNLLRPPNPDANSCSASVCPKACSDIGSTLVSTDFNPNTNRCVCGCSQTTQTWEYAKKTPGSNTCFGDCSVACGGVANVDPQQDQSQNTVTIDCITAADCSVGQFSSYKNVACVKQVVGPNENPGNWPPDGKKPVCQIEPTKENADKECQLYGGAAKNGICTFIGSGENPDASYKSRPYIQANGTYANVNFTAAYGNTGQLNTAIDAATINAPNVKGLCQRYGEAQNSGRYICVKSKKNTCGTVTPPNTLTIKTANSYSCVLTSDLAAKGINANTSCFPPSGSDAKGNDYGDLCINSPGTLCCSQGGGGCLGDLDCSLDGSMVCVGGSANPLKYGTCEWKTICDSAQTDRRCRYASPAEIANTGICSAESILQSVQRRCPNQAQYCCKAPDLQALSSCAADLSTNLNFNSGGRSYKDYTCITGTQIPASEYVPGSTTLKSWQNGGNCLGSDVLVGGGATGQTIARCSSGQVCCNAKQLQFVQDVTDYFNRTPHNAACGTSGLPVKFCTSPSDIVKSEADAQKRGYPTLTAFYAALAASGGCQVTPYSPGNLLDNKECVKGDLCCISAFAQGGFCDKDADCDPNNYCDPKSPNFSQCKKCDLATHLCIDAGLHDQKLNDQSCFVRAVAAGENGDQSLNVSGADKDSYSCQLVLADNTGAQSCLKKGCENENAQGAAQGGTFQCCPPGIGAAPSGVAATAAGAEEGVKPSAATIGLPPCIRTGQCQLSDILWTGAQFANFLIGISGAVFLGIFVYGGFLYLTAGGNDTRVGNAKKMIVQSTIAMVLMMGGFIIIRFIQTSLIATTAGQDVLSGRACSDLSTKDTQYACVFLTTDPKADPKGFDKELKDRNCQRGKCPGASICCPL